MKPSHTTEHSITVNAPATGVFDLIARADDWPRLFPPNIHVEYLERGEDHERLRIWATARDEVKTWTSYRELDRAGLRVRFRQEVPAHPVTAMGGEWLMEAEAGGRTRVRFTHDFEAAGDDPRDVEWIREVIDRNTTAELGALRDAAERDRHGDLTHSFEDTVVFTGTAERAYEFLHDAAQWSRRLPHVAACAVEESTPGIQTMDMDTLTADGSTHSTRSVRICFPHKRIVYKQLRTPALLTAHTGEWLVAETAVGVEIVSRHTVTIAPEAIPEILGADADIGRARSFVREALGRNSRTTMEHARAFAEKDSTV